MRRDDFQCALCGDKTQMQSVHHLYYTRGAEPWDYPDTALVTTCEDCHEEMHAMRFGDSMLEAFIAGGANIRAMHALLLEFQLAFVEGTGPHAKRYDERGWEDIVEGFMYLVGAIRSGAKSQDVRGALWTLRHPEE